MAVNSYLARLGSPDPIVPAIRLDELSEGFEVSRLGRAGPKFDLAELSILNAKVLALLPYEAVSTRLAALGMTGADEHFWLAVRGNLEKLADARQWHHVCHGEVRPVIDDPAFTAAAAKLLPEEPWDERTWSGWTGAVKAAMGKSGKGLFMPLRLALTGVDHGPELKNLLPLIGRSRALDDLVVDVRDVANIRDIEVRGAQPTDHGIEHDHDARVSEVTVVVDGHAADVHVDLARLDGYEILLRTGERVVDLEH